MVRRVRQDLVSVLFHCLKMLPMVRAQDKVHLCYDLLQQGSLGMEAQGLWWLRLHTLERGRAAGAQSQLHSIPWHVPNPHQTAAARGAVAAHTPSALTGLLAPWGSTANSLGSCQPRAQCSKPGTNSPKTSPASGQRGDTSSCPWEVLPFLLTH